MAKDKEDIIQESNVEVEEIEKIEDIEIENVENIENIDDIQDIIEDVKETEEIEELKSKRRSLRRIEEGIKSSKKGTRSRVSKTKDNKTTKVAKKTRKSRNKKDEQNAIKMHTEDNMTEITLRQNKYKIEMQKNEYNIYTQYNETSYIIVREPKLRIVVDGAYILIEKQEGQEEYAITTNQDFKINYVIDNVERRDNVLNFKLTNLTQIEAVDDGLIFEIDEEKIIENNLEDNNTLVISEEEGKVYLPYTKEEIKNEVLQNKKMKIADVIEEKYTKPLDKYKNSIRARFREGYNLMYQREGKSKKSAIILGIELMFESNLHPAIISACKNLEELDIYLDCLEDNELEKFSCFKIIYKSLPTLRKNTKYQQI